MSKFDLTQKQLNSPAHAIKSLIRGFLLLSEPGLRRFIWMPILVNFVIYGLALWLAVEGFGLFMNWVIPVGFDWLRWLLWPFFAVSLMLVTFFSFTLIANLIAAPFYGAFAQRLAEKVPGTSAASGSAGSGLIKSAVGSGLSEVRRLRYYLARAVPLLFLFVIPGVNLLAPVLWILFSAWFLALEFTAYPLEQDGVLFPDQLHLLKGSRLGLVTFGSLAMVGLAIPILNIFVPPAAIAGATIYLAVNRPVSDG